MRITDLLDARSILLNASPKSKNEALDQIVDLMVKSEKINDKEAYRKQVYAREEESTTGIGEGIAIPHGKCDAVTKPGLAAMVVKDGVDFNSLDGEPVTLMFLIAAPNTEDNIHLDVLSKLSVLLMNEEFTEALRNAETVEEFMGIINDADEKEAGIDERLAGEGTAAEEETRGKVKILAVTSCPTGIAHTYMAAEGIEKAAKAKDCAVKVETRGSGGAKNVLTSKEIEEAESQLQQFTSLPKTFSCRGREQQFYISLGYAEYPTFASSLSQLMRCADAALYEIKLHGKNGCMSYSKKLQSVVRKQLGFALRDISEHLPGAFIIYRADKEDDELFYANHEFLSMTGYQSMDEFFRLTNKSFHNLIREDEQQQIEASIWEQIDSGNENDYIHFHLRKADGSYLSVLDHGRIVESPQYGKVFYVLFMDWEDMHIHYSDKFSG